MKVLLISTSDKGGAAKACIRLHKALLLQGVDSRLLVLRKTNNEIAHSYAYSRGTATNSFIARVVRRIKVLRFHKKRYKLLKNLPNCFFHFPDNPQTDITTQELYDWADLINLHWVAGFLDWQSFFSKCNKPVVWTLHDMLPFTGGNHYQTDFYPAEYSSLLTRNLRIKQKSLRSFDNLAVVSPSKWLFEESNKSKLFGMFKHFCIPTSLDTSVFRYFSKQFCKELFGLKQSRRVILFVADSVTDNRKGFKLLKESFDLIRDENTDLVALGGNASSLTDEGAISIGRILDERLMAMAYNAADIFVIPSLEDNLPNTVLESLCCGTPVVGFKIGGISDMIIHKTNGILVNEISTKSLGDGIKIALNMEFDSNKISQDAQEKYTHKVQAQRYKDLYKNL